MKRLMKMFEHMMVSITFAESGEYDLVKEMIADEWRSVEVSREGSEEAVQPVRGTVQMDKDLRMELKYVLLACLVTLISTYLFCQFLPITPFECW
ncbi:MAG TPA: hypothetical protein VMU21_10385 [Thermodesulfovibrionales bacterium]|nr:hypothetical protein [Thermodesulfovibrionales bacterium]